MDELAARMRRVTAVNWLLPLFFASGATALTYQTLWVRELQLVFGTSTFAISTVLAAFMGGLAAGGFIMARYADRLTRPLYVYGWLEIGIGIYALIFPFIVSALAPVYLTAWRALQPGPVMFGLIQFALVGTALLLPTAAMGATLPLLARFATHNVGDAGDRVGTLYAINTFGAVIGTLLCGFVLLPQLGRLNTGLLAAGANVVLGLAALQLSRWASEEVRTPGPSGPMPHLPTLPVVTVAIGLAGFSALVYEVAWTRLLGLMLGGSTYTFSVMLVAFLVGIALGGRIGGPMADRWLDQRGQTGVLLAFASIEVGIAVVSYAMMYLYPELPFIYVGLFDSLGVLGMARRGLGSFASGSGHRDDVAGDPDGHPLPVGGPRRRGARGAPRRAGGAGLRRQHPRRRVRCVPGGIRDAPADRRAGHHLRGWLGSARRGGAPGRVGRDQAGGALDARGPHRDGRARLGHDGPSASVGPHADDVGDVPLCLIVR